MHAPCPARALTELHQRVEEAGDGHQEVDEKHVLQLELHGRAARPPPRPPARAGMRAGSAGDSGVSARPRSAPARPGLRRPRPGSRPAPARPGSRARELTREAAAA